MREKKKFYLHEPICQKSFKTELTRKQLPVLTKNDSTSLCWSEETTPPGTDDLRNNTGKEAHRFAHLLETAGGKILGNVVFLGLRSCHCKRLHAEEKTTNPRGSGYVQQS